MLSLRSMVKIRAIAPYLAAGFLLAWLIVNADGWDPAFATRDAQVLQVWSQYILLTLACLGAIYQSFKHR
jgi:hypothetical protein